MIANKATLMKYKVLFRSILFKKKLQYYVPRPKTVAYTKKKIVKVYKMLEIFSVNNDKILFSCCAVVCKHFIICAL